MSKRNKAGRRCAQLIDRLWQGYPDYRALAWNLLFDFSATMGACIDLGTVRDRFLAGSYHTVDQFVRDVQTPFIHMLSFFSVPDPGATRALDEIAEFFCIRRLPNYAACRGVLGSVSALAPPHLLAKFRFPPETQGLYGYGTGLCLNKILEKLERNEYKESQIFLLEVRQLGMHYLDSDLARDPWIDIARGIRDAFDGIDRAQREAHLESALQWAERYTVAGTSGILLTRQYFIDKIVEAHPRLISKTVNDYATWLAEMQLIPGLDDQLEDDPLQEGVPPHENPPQEEPIDKSLKAYYVHAKAAAARKKTAFRAWNRQYPNEPDVFEREYNEDLADDIAFRHWCHDRRLRHDGSNRHRYEQEAGDREQLEAKRYSQWIERYRQRGVWFGKGAAMQYRKAHGQQPHGMSAEDEAEEGGKMCM